MRRTLGYALVCLGVLALALAPLLRWYAYPRIAVVDDTVAESGENVVTLTSVGEDVTVLDIALVAAGEAEATRVTTVTSERTVRPDRVAGTDDVAVWDSRVSTTDAEGSELSGFTERIAFDRRTSELVEGFEQYYQPTGSAAEPVAVERSGYYLRFPFDTQRVDHDVWDPTLQDSRPATFEGEEEIDGLGVYRFVQEVEATDVAEVQVPGRLVGASEAAVAARRMYATTRTLWVEPATGAIVRARDEPDVYLDFQGQRGPTVLQGTLEYADDTVAANVERYEPRARTLTLVHTVGPIAGIVFGLVSVGVAAVLLRPRRRYVPRRAAGANGEGPAIDPDR